MSTARRPVLRTISVRPAHVPLLISAFLALMCAAWLMTVPPGSSGDEAAHYVKAYGVGHGDLDGRPVTEAADLEALFRLSPRALEQAASAERSPSVRWQQRTRREFELPPALFDPRLGCTALKPWVTGACLSQPAPPNRRLVQKTYVGTYQPYAYVGAGLAIRAADTPSMGIRLGRLAVLLPALALLVAAAWLLWTPSAPGASLLGLLVAVTPMVVFIASMLSTSGLEIAGAICFAAALLRLARPEPSPGWIWVALGASGAVLASSRTLGPAFVVVLAGSVALLAGPRVLARTARDGGRRAAAAGVAIAVAISASVVWQVAYQPRPDPSGDSALDAVRPSIDHLPEIGEMAIGVFGSLDAEMPLWGHVVWGSLLVALTAAALVAGRVRDRLSVVGVLLGIVAVVVVMSVVYREIGPLQGRYALPVLVLIPLWIGEVVLRRRERLPAAALRGLVVAVFAGTLAVHVLGLWATGRRFAVGEGLGWRFFTDAAWSPPLGWWPWALIAVAAACAYLAAGAVAVVLTRRNTA